MLPTWLLAKGRSSPKDLVGCEQFWLDLCRKGMRFPTSLESWADSRFWRPMLVRLALTSSVVDVCEYMDVEYVDA